MKTIIYTSIFLLSTTLFGQEELNPDTTRVNMGKIEIILVDHSNEDLEDEGEIDTMYAIPNEDEKERF